MKLGALAILACATAVAAPGKLVRVASPDLDAMPSRGPKQALVTIELFFHPHQDTRLPFFKAIEQLQANHPSRVRILYRVLKASSSSRLHYATLEAYAEGRFAAFLDELDKPSTSINLTDAQLLQVAAAAGMNGEQLAEVLATPPAEFDRVLDDNLRRFKQRFRNSQQGVLINGKFISRNDIDKPGELERVYDDEKDKALDLLDRGVEPRDLAAAFETEEAPNPLFINVPSSSPDDTIGEVPPQPVLATPALELRGMPSFGPTDAYETIAVLCIPSTTTNSCRAALRAAKLAQDVYGDRVRVVWAPFFDVTREDAADLGMLADAALCAERVGASIVDFGSPSSPGWDWLQGTMDEISRSHRRVTAERVLAELATLLHVDEHAFAACRAHQAGAAIQWVEAATRAGVHASPSTVVGGRIYPSITDASVLQQLVASELEPGDCDGCLRLDSIVPAWRSHGLP